MSMKRGSILRIEATERLTPVFGDIELEADRAARQPFPLPPRR